MGRGEWGLLLLGLSAVGAPLAARAQEAPPRAPPLGEGAPGEPGGEREPAPPGSVAPIGSSRSARRRAELTRADDPWLPRLQQPPARLYDEDGDYRTPLAGEALEVEVLGEWVEVSARDRRTTRAISLGGAFFLPSLGGTTFTPLGGLFAVHRSVKLRARSVIALAYNEIDLARNFGGPELIGHVENYTPPVATAEVVDGRVRQESSLLWGEASVWVGGGYRWRVAPFAVDNDLRIGLYYRGGYEYHERTDDTPDDSRVPTDTYVHGLQFRVRFDALQRNLLELPHLGFAGGFDVGFLRRDHWRSYGNPARGTIVPGRETRDYTKVSGYLVLALPVPGLSSRHRLILGGSGGWAERGSLDRFSAFRVGGGPPSSESYDLERNAIPGARFDQFPLDDYLIGSAEYRYELTFFAYLHARVTYLVGHVASRRAARPEIERVEGPSLALGLTTGFLWQSQIYAEVSHDPRGVFRGRRGSGSAILVYWGKSF